VLPDATIRDVAELMISRRISGVPVVDGEGRLVGIVTEGDLMRRIETGTERERSWWLKLLTDLNARADEFVKSHSRRVSDVMTRDVATVDEDTALADIVELMEERRIKRVPVVRDSRVVGVVSRADLVRALVMAPNVAETAEAADDDAIRERVLDAFRREKWLMTGYVNVTVANGVVYLWGLAEGAAQRNAMRVAAENVSGVREVRDHLTSRFAGYGI